jgi:hypothetical protein
MVVGLGLGLRPGLGGDDGEPGVSQHGERDMAVPGVPEADLVLVEADLVLAGLEALLDVQRTPTTATSSASGVLVGEWQMK